MLSDARAFSGFAVKDTEQAKDFYSNVLGIEVEVLDETNGLLTLHLNGQDTMLYRKEDHSPANFTILNFEVDDIETTVDDLVAKGVHIETYEGFEQDDKGIARGKAANMGPDIAWFKDPSGNILSVLER